MLQPLCCAKFHGVTPWMHADPETIVCKFGGDPAIFLREEAICAKVYRRTDGRTDDGRRAIALAHSWNELKRTGTPFRSLKKEPKRRSGAFRSHPIPACRPTRDVAVDIGGVMCFHLKHVRKGAPSIRQPIYISVI